MPALRARAPEAVMFLHSEDAAAARLADGDAAVAETLQGAVTMAVAVRDDMPRGFVRIPYGWWLPEMAEGDGGLSGAWDLADAQLCRDDPDFLDAEQGIPHLKGIPCRVRAAG